MCSKLCLFLSVVSVLPFSHAQNDTWGVACPPNSGATENSESTGDYCVCNQGFLRLGESCVVLNQCPPNSTSEFTLTVDASLENTTEEFTLTAGSCTCLDGFMSIEGGCFIVYSCPPKSAKPWALLVADCVCIDGYTRVNETCVPEESAGTLKSFSALFIPWVAVVIVVGLCVVGTWFAVQFMTTAVQPPAFQPMQHVADLKRPEFRIEISDNTRKKY